MRRLVIALLAFSLIANFGSGSFCYAQPLECKIEKTVQPINTWVQLIGVDQVEEPAPAQEAIEPPPQAPDPPAQSAPLIASVNANPPLSLLPPSQNPVAGVSDPTYIPFTRTNTSRFTQTKWIWTKGAWNFHFRQYGEWWWRYWWYWGKADAMLPWWYVHGFYIGIKNFHLPHFHLKRAKTTITATNTETGYLKIPGQIQPLMVGGLPLKGPNSEPPNELQMMVPPPAASSPATEAQAQAQALAFDPSCGLPPECCARICRLFYSSVNQEQDGTGGGIVCLTVTSDGNVNAHILAHPPMNSDEQSHFDIAIEDASVKVAHNSDLQFPANVTAKHFSFYFDVERAPGGPSGWQSLPPGNHMPMRPPHNS